MRKLNLSERLSEVSKVMLPKNKSRTPSPMPLQVSALVSIVHCFHVMQEQEERRSLRVRIWGVVLWALTLLYLWIERKGCVGFLFLSRSFSFLLNHIVVAMVVSKIFIPVCVMPQPLPSTHLYLSEKPNLWTICLISGEGFELKLFSCSWIKGAGVIGVFT